MLATDTREPKMIPTRARALIVGFVLLALTGCAAPARVSQMVAYAPEPSDAQTASQWNRSMALITVTGGESTNPMWTSEVGNAEFHEALRQSLHANGLLASEGQPAKYGLNAELIEVSQPLFGFDLTVTSNVHYVVTDTASSAVAFDEIITASHTATVGDAFVAVERLRLANEGSVKENIRMFIDNLIRQQ